MFFIASFLKYGLTTKFVFTNDSEVKVGIDLIENEIRGPIGTNEIVFFESPKYTVEDPEYQVAVETLTAEIAELGPDIIRPESLGNFYSNGLPFLVSEDRGSTLITLIMAGDFDQNADNIEAVVDVVHEYAATETGNFVIKVTGQATIGLDNRELSQEDLEKGEAMGVPIALIILIAVLGGIAAALVPLVMAIVSIIVTIGISALVGTFFELSLFVTNIITIIGLAVGIDYSLFVVSRYREERGRGLDKIDAIGKAGATAGRAVVFSGITVVLALVGMLLIPFNIFISIGLGAIFVVLSAMAAAMTLLPAILGIMGDKVNSLQIPFIGKGQVEFQPDRKGGFWDKLVRMVMAQPIISLLLTGGLLIALIIPFFNINTGFAGISTYPDELESKQAFLVLDEKLSFGEVTPAEIVISGDISSAPVQAGIERLKVLLAEDVEGAFGEPRELEVSDAGTLAVLAVPVAGDTSGEFSIAAATRLNGSYVEEAFAGTDTEIYVTDETAFNIEFFKISSESAKIVLPFVLGISFLLSRIRAHYDQSGDTNEAVAFGIRSTGRLIT
jgi:RND superfamily putative drug exporter